MVCLQVAAFIFNNIPLYSFNLQAHSLVESVHIKKHNKVSENVFHAQWNYQKSNIYLYSDILESGKIYAD